MLSSTVRYVTDIFNKFPKQPIVITSDLTLTAFAFWYVMYTNMDIEDSLWTDLLQNTYIMSIEALSYWVFGLYRGVWRFASVPDLIRIIKGCIAGTCLLLISSNVFQICKLPPHFSFTLFCLLSIFLLGGSRLLYRWYKDNRKVFSGGLRLLVIGAGTAGESILREVKRKTYQDYLPIGLIDDDPLKLGYEIQGIRVLGGTQDLLTIVKQKGIELILIALPKATAAQMRRVVALCEKTQIPYRTLPSFSDIARGSAQITHMRPVLVEDLLSRDPIQFDKESLYALVEHKRILITGAGGSIGSELCRQIAELNPQAIILVEHSEYNLFQILSILKKEFPQLTIHHYLLSITNEAEINHLMRVHKPNYVFHAAGYKHVPLLEPQVKMAIFNNIFGTQHLAMAALQNEVERFIFVSTDKAVNPVNVMGATKRAAEILCQSLNQLAKTRFVTVRFGNVLGSTGSVVPLFKQQIAEGGPLTITHPDMERYFMTISEATQLIIQTLTIKNPNDLYVLDMGEPIKIQYLAEQMIKLSGRKPYVEIGIAYSGLRPGEKIHEELFYKRETIAYKEKEKILCVKSPLINTEKFMQQLKTLQNVYAEINEERLKALLFDLLG